MFDFAWSEIALIAGVALVLIGPKDLPVAIRTVTGMIKKARRMASEFQTHVDEMVREANLDEVRTQINEIRSFDVRSHVERAVDPDGALRSTFNERVNLTPAAAPATAVDPLPEVIVPEPPPASAPAPAEPGEERICAAEDVRAPAWIPPNLVPPLAEPARVHAQAEPPAWIPPSIATRPRS